MMTPTERIEQLRQSLRAERERPDHPRARARRREAARLWALGCNASRPGDRLRRALTAKKRQPGDDAYLARVLACIEAHKGNVASIAADLDVGARTVRRWMADLPAIGKAIRVAAARERLRLEEAR